MWEIKWKHSIFRCLDDSSKWTNLYHLQNFSFDIVMECHFDKMCTLKIDFKNGANFNSLRIWVVWLHGFIYRPPTLYHPKIFSDHQNRINHRQHIPNRDRTRTMGSYHFHTRAKSWETLSEWKLSEFQTRPNWMMADKPDAEFELFAIFL